MLGWKRTMSLPLRSRFRFVAARAVRDRVSPEGYRCCAGRCPQCDDEARDGSASAPADHLSFASDERGWPEMAVIA